MDAPPEAMSTMSTCCTQILVSEGLKEMADSRASAGKI